MNNYSCYQHNTVWTTHSALSLIDINGDLVSVGDIFNNATTKYVYLDLRLKITYGSVGATLRKNQRVAEIYLIPIYNSSYVSQAGNVAAMTESENRIGYLYTINPSLDKTEYLSINNIITPNLDFYLILKPLNQDFQDCLLTENSYLNSLSYRFYSPYQIKAE